MSAAQDSPEQYTNVQCYLWIRIRKNPNVLAESGSDSDKKVSESESEKKSFVSTTLQGWAREGENYF
jgi:hypothetical protein